MHEGETCAAYQARAAEDEQRRQRQQQENEESEKLLGTISKPCPKCGRNLDKYTGCDHVKCKPAPILGQQKNTDARDRQYMST